MDNMVVKRKKEEEHVADLTEVFGILRRQKLRLNANKCAFSVGTGKFFGI